MFGGETEVSALDRVLHKLQCKDYVQRKGSLQRLC